MVQSLLGMLRIIRVMKSIPVHEIKMWGVKDDGRRRAGCEMLTLALTSGEVSDRSRPVTKSVKKRDLLAASVTLAGLGRTGPYGPTEGLWLVASSGRANPDRRVKLARSSRDHSDVIDTPQNHKRRPLKRRGGTWDATKHGNER